MLRISEKILKLCDEPTKDNYDEVLTEAFTEILINFEMSSDIVSSFVKKFKKCGKKFFKTPSDEESQVNLQDNNVVHEGDRKDEGAKINGLPEYMKRMLIITGFAGNEQYMEDTTNRIINYIFNEKFEELLSLVLIHYGNDFVREHDGNFRIRKRKLGNNEVAIMKLQNEQENLDKEVKLIENELEKLDEEIKATEEEHLKDIKLKIEEKEKAKTEKNEKLKEIADKISALINGNGLDNN
uniref:Uncharacterized protein n=1 Tax=Meloidogyne floridensis TaxID=298350 RepID=A0A915NVL7_9BILA